MTHKVLLRFLNGDEEVGVRNSVTPHAVAGEDFGLGMGEAGCQEG